MNPTFNGKTFLPLRWAVIPPQHFFGLGRDCDTGQFYVASYSGVSGVVALRGPYADFEVARSNFEVLAGARAKEPQEKILERLDEDGELTVEERCEELIEAARLELLDDAAFNSVLAEAREFCRTHTDAEIDGNVRKLREACERQQAEEDDA